jgi:hypothetical protein
LPELRPNSHTDLSGKKSLGSDQHRQQKKRQSEETAAKPDRELIEANAQSEPNNGGSPGSLEKQNTFSLVFLFLSRPEDKEPDCYQHTRRRIVGTLAHSSTDAASDKEADEGHHRFKRGENQTGAEAFARRKAGNSQGGRKSERIEAQGKNEGRNNERMHGDSIVAFK